ncbi:MAG: cobyric acid synthase [Oscillospiraceae bacterium]|jgi:adenosylcobyric acid synthase|nr:cobyric acid synthase [Oscillospiraceae bacterium]
MAKSIMVQGTMSNAGKSLITAGLCRVFKQDGFKVAPFKSQNMALNSYITRSGLEMGRAQVMQAEACGIEPAIEMNPILLKPTGETGSQVIVNGEVLGDMPARDYFARKRSFIPDIMRAYGQLDSSYDIVVLEGAGSPAEINLKKDDIVNMGMAKMAGAPVLLVGDIDRGGVFASLYGTVALLEEDERRMIKGLIVNKFRGDISILEPGLEMITALTGIPVTGTLPYLTIDIDDEDSLAPRLSGAPGQKLLDIAVIRLPHISNFTDFSPLSRYDEAGLRYVWRAGDFAAPDLVILPGTKNTLSDLSWLRQSGLEAKVKQHAAHGGAVIGICGGYQMLGTKISDPRGVEQGGDLLGIGLLPVSTLFHPEKTRTRVTGTIENAGGLFSALNGLRVQGYEIHMGETLRGDSADHFCTLDNGGALKEDGAAQGNVWGSYLHGIFDSDAFTHALIDALLQSKGFETGCAPQIDYAAYRETQYDLLADAVRTYMNMDAIYEILNKGL